MKKDNYLKRFKALAGIRATTKNSYLIKITFQVIVAESLNEHNIYSNFKNSTNRYMYHPESTNPPVKAHYQVYPQKGKSELYAVLVDDGKAHHKKNRGYQIPKKEADELRSLGVNLPDNNILEIITRPAVQILNEEVYVDNTIYILIS
jgi:hypothetical protein